MKRTREEKIDLLCAQYFLFFLFSDIIIGVYFVAHFVGLHSRCNPLKTKEQTTNLLTSYKLFVI